MTYHCERCGLALANVQGEIIRPLGAIVEDWTENVIMLRCPRCGKAKPWILRGEMGEMRFIVDDCSMAAIRLLLEAVIGDLEGAEWSSKGLRLLLGAHGVWASNWTDPLHAGVSLQGYTEPYEPELPGEDEVVEVPDPLLSVEVAMLGDRARLEIDCDEEVTEIGEALLRGLAEIWPEIEEGG